MHSYVHRSSLPSAGEREHERGNVRSWGSALDQQSSTELGVSMLWVSRRSGASAIAASFAM